MRLATPANLAWLIVYLVTITALVLTILDVRQTTLASHGTDEKQQHWAEWKTEAPQVGRSHKNPVEHPEPKAEEPPALILMRDHFAVVIGGGLLFGSLLFGSIMVAIRGIFASRAR